MVELIEVIVKGLCTAYALAIFGVTQLLKNEARDRFFLYMTYVLAMTLKEKKKKKPDIATKKDPLVGLTQAEILAAQREKAKDIGGIGEAKGGGMKAKKPKGSPKRKGPPKKDKGPKKGDSNNV
ncbi:hypothetical protein B5M09_006752 [Aphanomyces astaci]|uniref:Uncharacterized protein n=1 Tax=Aphanomyces astaci TaxID=112090 RepID=A0A425DPF5_APHAT|nr:hypothetical protein B5M09_006752 [Aphanomyces astaci]